MHLHYWGALLLPAILLLTGCGPSLVKVNGVVKMDGNSVEGATVTFISEDGKNTYSGFTNASGDFSLAAGSKEGVVAGTYKVIVTKTAKMDGEAITGGGGGEGGPGAGYIKAMEKMGKDQTKSGPPKGAGPGMKMPPGAGGAAAVKSELPAIYAVASTTPLTAKIPQDPQPIIIDLKAKP